MGENGSITVRDVIMDVIIAAAVASQLYFVLDELTDGRFSREVSIKITKARAKIKELIEIEQRVQRETGQVIYDAIETIEGSAGDRNTGGTTGSDGAPPPDPFRKS